MNRIIIWLILLLIPYQTINVCVAESSENGTWMMKDGVKYRVSVEMLDNEPNLQVNRAADHNVKIQKNMKKTRTLVVTNRNLIEADDNNQNAERLAAPPKKKEKKRKRRKKRGKKKGKKMEKYRIRRRMTKEDGLCGKGEKQSPINFDPASLVIVRMNNTFKMDIINFNSFTAIPSLITMTNTGYTVKVLMQFDDEKKHPYIGGRLLSDAIFHFKEIIFHWGADLS